MEEPIKYNELSEIINKLEDISRVVDMRIEYSNYAKEYSVKAGNITTSAPNVRTAMKMFISAYENFNRPNKLEKLIEEVTTAKDDMFQTLVEIGKADFYRKAGN